MYVLKSNSYIFFTQCHFKMGKNISTVEKRQIVNALLTKMGLDERSTTIVAKLSSGERRRLGLAEEVSRYQVNITPTPISCIFLKRPYNTIIVLLFIKIVVMDRLGYSNRFLWFPVCILANLPIGQLRWENCGRSFSFSGPLFLHHHSKARVNVPLNWLGGESKFWIGRSGPCL